MANMHDSPSDYSDFQKKGYPGTYISASAVADGMTAYTGSNYGASAVIVKTHGSAVFHLADGGEISASLLTAGVVYDFSLREIRSASSAVIFVLKKHG